MIKNEYLLVKNNDIINAIKIVPKKSNIAILNNLYECTPSLGLPNISLYLHKISLFI